MNLKPFRFGPLALTATLTTNILNPPTASGGVNAGSSAQYIILQHIHIVNKGALTGTFSLWLGATGANAAGTEFIGTAITVTPGIPFDWYSPGVPILSTDFLVGGASAGTLLTIQGEGEIGVAG